MRDDSTPNDKSAPYQELVDAIDSLLNGEPDPTANLANAAAVIYHTLPGLNWAGFYLLRDNELYQSALTLTCMRVGLVWRLRAKSIR